MKSGTQDPESGIDIVGDAIIDVGATAFADFAGTAGQTYRGITIAPTQDLVLGSAVVSWTWKEVPFEVFVTKA